MELEFSLLCALTVVMTGSRGSEVTEVFANRGSTAVLPCKCSTSHYPHTVVWSHVNKGTVWRKQKSGLQYRGAAWAQKGIHRVQCPHPQYNRGDYSLHILQVKVEDGGKFKCRVEDGRQVTENVVMLRVITVSVSPPVAIWGDDVFISCTVNPWPYRGSVQWTLNDRPYRTLSKKPSAEETGAVVVREKATTRVTGNWSCAMAYKGAEGRALATLTVKGILQPSTDDTKLYAAVGSAAVLPCVFSDSVTPSGPVWEKLKPGSLFKPASGPLPASFSPSLPTSRPRWDVSATVTEVSPEDKGRFRCSASVEGQKLTRTMQLVVAKIDSSGVAKKKGSLALTCQLTDTSEVTKYEWIQVVRGLNGVQVEGSIHDGKTLTINQASEENQGEWVCRFYGKNGILGNVTYQLTQMSGLTGEKSSGSTQNTALLVGLSFLLFVLLLILAQMYKNHRRRKRIFQFPALETVIHAASNEREEKRGAKERKSKDMMKNRTLKR